MIKTIERRKVPLSEENCLSQIHPVLRRVYLSRGITQESELEQQLKDLIPYHSLGGIEAAVTC